MIRLSLALALLLLPLAAFAQGEEPAPAAGASYASYTSPTYGFTISLPASGSIEDPTTEGWSEDAEVAFNWYYAGEEPIVLIQGRVDKFDAALDNETFKIFADTLLGNWTGDPEKYTVVTANDTLDLNGMKWNLIEVEDASDPEGTKVYYSVFSTFSGSNIYTVSMYYLEPVNETIQQYGFPVLDGFKVVGS